MARVRDSGFITFNDGALDICNVNDEDRLERVKQNLRYGNENVGIIRHYAARAADTRVDRLLHILQQKDIRPHQVAVADGEQYDIEKADHISSTTPPVTKLSLIRLEKHREREFS